jgi:hypothetical protein
MTRPAASAAPSGLNGESPLAISSALTNSNDAGEARQQVVDFGDSGDQRVFVTGFGPRVHLAGVQAENRRVDGQDRKTLFDLVRPSLDFSRLFGMGFARALDAALDFA